MGAAITRKPPDVWDSKQKAIDIAKAILDKKGEEISLLYVGALSPLTDYYLICSASSEPHIWALVDAVETVLQKHKRHPLGIEGRKTAPWVLVDCSDVIIHIFKQQAREFYNLDGLWSDAKSIDFGIDLSEPPVTDPLKVPKKKVR